MPNLSLQSVNAMYAPRRDSVDDQNEIIKITLSVIRSYLLSMLILKKERVICNANEGLGLIGWFGIYAIV